MFRLISLLSLVMALGASQALAGWSVTCKVKGQIFKVANSRVYVNGIETASKKTRKSNGAEYAFNFMTETIKLGVPHIPNGTSGKVGVELKLGTMKRDIICDGQNYQPEYGY
jgi:hypothetical protein